MNNRFELLRWINRRYPQQKVNSIEQLSDGKHFLLVLSELFPSIDVSKLQRGVNLLQRIENMKYVNSQFEMLGINIKVEVIISPLSLQISKIANKNTLSIINLLKQLISYVEANNRNPDIIIEEPQQQQSEFQEEYQELRSYIAPQPYQQEMKHNEVSLLLIRIKEIVLSNMSHRDLKLELVKLLGDDNDQDLVKLSNCLNNQLEEETHSYKKISKITNYESLRSSQFYQNGEDNNILEQQFSFSQPRTSWDSLFFVSDCKPDQN